MSTIPTVRATPASARETEQPAPPRSRATILERHVRYRVQRLQTALLDPRHRDHSVTVAQLARLRRARIDDPGDPSIWDVVFEDAPEEILGVGDTPSREERALHAALVLYAIHAQSADAPRHANGRRLGLALGRMARDDDPDDPASTAIARRFRAFATATTADQALVHLRGLVTLMRQHGATLDYGSLARDLRMLQTRGGLRRARLQWGRDFHFFKTENDTTDKES